MKQYKKGLKTAEQILKKSPDHGESRAMHGLLMFQLDQKEDGYREIEKGVELDPGSHIVWHAVRCYLKALTLDQHNFQILRDLASMQIHCAIMQVTFVDLYADTYKPHPPPRDWDFSEMLLYRNQILHESGDLDTTLSHLDVIEPLVCDVRAVREKRAQVLLEMGRQEQAMMAYAELVKTNPDCRTYVDGFIKASGERAEDVLEGLVVDYPKSNLMPVMYLNALPADSDAFESALRNYLEANIVRGVPSLWANLRQLYDDQIPTDAMVNGREPFRMWIEYFLAQHYDRTGEYAKAIEHAQRAVAEQPPKDTDSGNGGDAVTTTSSSSSAVTVPELLLLQARIYKHAGNAARARDLANAAREADLKDRYVNTKCVKYMLRADDLAIGGLALAANAYGLSLKRLHQIIAHFREFDDDQFDFHTYCLRKMTLRAYVDMLQWEDRSRAHAYFERAAQACVREYIRLYEAPAAVVKAQVAEAEEAVKEMAQGKDPDKDKHGSSMPDPDPLGLEYVGEADPLAQAAKIVKMLEAHHAKSVATHVLAFDVAYRQGRWVIAMRAVQKMVSVSVLGAGEPEMHVRAMMLAQRVGKDDVDGAVRGIVIKGLHELLAAGEPVPSELDVVAMNAHFDEAKSVVDGMLALGSPWSGTTFKQARQVWELVGAVGFGGSEEAAELAARLEESARAWFAIE
ncbi:NMDA receptor-regulated protein 1-domain-containing protein [Catenaria anguillulae PL171]|uniref:NMDA receptor-regulated protein 1-domain-containing protein n=1 Tax=Catenaria anguillulae PL171 TaxID=765915 RepID=A0A1Y2HYA6_9FUNG|nr:NMDA receptor-regulated protein 1-domain-containing protein [Catenaria anguillulae PL171]